MIAARTVIRVVAALVATTAGLAVLAAASAVSLPWHGADTAALRLSWSARPERIEVCRALSDAEIEALNEHMRQRVECDGRSATYALRVRVDGVLLGDEVVRGGGLRHDRPLHLLQTYEVSPGLRRIQLEFSRRERASGDSVSGASVAAPEADTGIFAGRAAREMSERGRRTRAAVPPRMTLDTALAFAPQQVILVTFDPDGRRLVVRADAAPRRVP
ncbi:MAG: hypothetical protein AABZ29_10340 [Gemmatimonadota bacterium]